MAPVAVEAKARPASPGSPSLKHVKAESPFASDSPLTPTDATASTSKRTLEHQDVPVQPPPKRIWTPTLHLTQPPQPPQPDPRTVSEMAAQSAATALGYEGRRIKKFMQRRTVDYFGALSHLRLRRQFSASTRPDGLRGGIYPSPHSIPNFLLPAGYANLSTSIPKQLVHTSTNKIRCPVNVVKWMPDGRRLLTGSTSGEFTLWNGLTFNFETIMQAHDSAVRAMAWTKSGTFLISADQNGTVKYFQSNLNTLQAFTAHADSARGLAFSPDDSKFASGGDDSLLKIWDFDSAKQIRELTGHGWDVKCLDWHASKGLLISGSKDNLVKVWDPRATPGGTCLGTFHNHKNTVQACKFSPDGQRFATASRDMTVKIYDLRMMAEQSTLRGHDKEVCSLDFHPIHSDLLVSGGSEGSMLFWDLSGASSESMSGVDWSESRMIGGGGEGMDAGQGRKSGDIVWRNDTAHESNIWSLQWHPFGHLLCSGSNDHMTRFWERARPNDSIQQHQQQDFNPSFLASNSTAADDSFIPGLGSFIPSQAGDQHHHQQQQAISTAQSHDIIPGLGLAQSAPQPQPQHAPTQNFAGWNQNLQPQSRPGGTYGSFY